MKTKITPAMFELRNAISELEGLSARAEISKRDETRINVLLAKISALRSGALAPDDYCDRWFKAMFRGGEFQVEQRGTDVLAGSQAISWTQGASGGYLVPQEFHDELVLGLSQNDPLLDEDIVTLIPSETFGVKPYTVPGWDLSSFSAVKIAESSQQNPLNVPTATATALGHYTYRASLTDTFEFEDDAFKPAMTLFKKAYAQAFARGIGVDLVGGNGTTAPQGILTGAHNSGVTTGAANVYTATDIENIYFALNTVYRSAPKCAWVMNDATYQLIRKAVDGNQRPLINVVNDKEVLMGKPIVICPSMPAGNGNQTIVFGDLSYFHVRVGRLLINRTMQASGYIEKAKVLYSGLMNADAKVIDPTGGGANSPIIYATQHA